VIASPLPPQPKLSLPQKPDCGGVATCGVSTSGITVTVHSTIVLPGRSPRFSTFQIEQRCHRNFDPPNVNDGWEEDPCLTVTDYYRVVLPVR
jgi:hypothetical protein